jgi:hypothetical protein
MDSPGRHKPDLNFKQPVYSIYQDLVSGTTIYLGPGDSEVYITAILPNIGHNSLFSAYSPYRAHPPPPPPSHKLYTYLPLSFLLQYMVSLSPKFWSYLTRKARTCACFWPEKHEVARAGGFVKFWTFSQNARFFVEYCSELVLQTARELSRAFKSTY